MKAQTRKNPLVVWDRKYTGSQGTGAYYYGPLLKADAHEKFAASMAVADRVLQEKGISPLRLNFHILPAVAIGSSDAVVWEMHVGRVAKENFAIGLLEYIHPRETTRGEKPGDPARETPHTLFNCLHRLAEFVSLPGKEKNGTWTPDPNVENTGLLANLPCLSPRHHHNFTTATLCMVRAAAHIQQYVERGQRPQADDSVYVRALYSSGLQTASGRLGAIDDPYQALAEAFAKYCLHPGLVYDPAVPIRLHGNVLELPKQIEQHVQNARFIWSQILQKTVRSLVRVLTMFTTGYYSGQRPSSTDVLTAEKMRLELLEGSSHVGTDLNPYLPTDFAVSLDNFAFQNIEVQADRGYADMLYQTIAARQAPDFSNSDYQQAQKILFTDLQKKATRLYFLYGADSVPALVGWTIPVFDWG